MKATISVASDIVQTARTVQLLGLFDVPPSKKSSLTWEVDLPIENKPWNVAAVTGQSGAGKSTIARELFSPYMRERFEWPADKAVVDGFPAQMGIKEIVELLSSVGFSSPPSWLRPFRVLSTGQQFRTHLARLLAENLPMQSSAMEFSTVDRTVAQIGSGGTREDRSPTRRSSSR